MHNKFIKTLKSALGAAAGTAMLLASPLAFADSEHIYIPKTDEKPDFLISKIDLKNSGFELLYNDTHAGGRSLQSIALYHFRYEGEPYDVLMATDEPGGVVWGDRLYYGSNFFGNLPTGEKIDEHTTLFKVKSSYPDLNEIVKNQDIIIVIHFDDDLYWAGRISYSDCASYMNESYAGCQAVAWEGNRDLYDVIYVPYEAEVGGGEDEEDKGNTSKPAVSETPEAPEDPEAPENSKAPVKPAVPALPGERKQVAQGTQPVRQIQTAEQAQVSSYLESSSTSEKTTESEVKEGSSNSGETKDSASLKEVAIPMLGGNCEGFRDLWWVWLLSGASLGALITWVLFVISKRKQRSEKR